MMTDRCDKENVTSSSDPEPFLKFIPFTNNKPVVKKESENDQHAILVLKHFADIPKLYFEKVKVGRTKSISLTIVNPSSHEHQIKIAKISELKGFTVNATSLCIQPQSQDQLEITWIPKIAGTVRDTLVLMSQNSHRLHVILHGTAIESPRKKKTRRRINEQRQHVDKLHKVNTSKPNQKAVLNTVIDVLQDDTNKIQKSQPNQKSTSNVGAIQSNADKNHQNKKEQFHTSATSNQQADREKFISSQLVDFKPNNHDNQPKKGLIGSHIIRETYTKAELEDSLLGSSNQCPDNNDTREYVNTPVRETYTRAELEDSLIGSCGLHPQSTNNKDQNNEMRTTAELEDSLLEDNNTHPNHTDNKKFNSQGTNSNAQFTVHVNKSLPNNRIKPASKSDPSNKITKKIGQQQQPAQSKAKPTFPKTFNVKGIAQSRLRLLNNTSGSKSKPKTISPFASQNNCYDDRWIDKQERGFTNWLNFILVPSEDGLSMNKYVTKVDASTLTLTTDTTLRQACPTKDTLSYKSYENRKHLMMLRKAACILYQSKPVRMVVERITDAVKERKFTFRTDTNIHSDLGIKQHLLDLLLSYNPLWLRIGLETIYGEILMIESNQDIIGLSTFIISRLLSNDNITKEYSRSINPESISNDKDYIDALGQYVIKQFLLLIFCIDQAKLTRLIDHDPCLFCMDAKFKSSRAIILAFSREYLRGEGDIIRHLGQFGYNVTHTQTPLDEYNYAVTNLAVDLRDGVRLARLIELFSREWRITSNLKLPVNSRLQKVKNIEASLIVLKEKKLLNNIEVKIYSSAVADGHREKTLALLWKIIQHYQVNIMLNADHLREEIICLRREYRKKLKLLSPDIDISYTIPFNDMYVDHPQLNLLLSWCQAVCKLYGIEINNFTASFADGRGLCSIVHHYHPGLLPYSKIRQETTLTNLNYAEDSDDMTALVNTKEGWSAVFSPTTGKASKYDKLKANEKYNFNLYNHKIQEMSGVPLLFKATQIINGIPEEKVMIAHISYLCSKLLEIRQESRAAICIQKVWRNYIDLKKLMIQQIKDSAAVKLQAIVRGYFTRKHQQNRINKAVIIQSYWRGYAARCLIADLREERLEAMQEYSAVVIQSIFRGYIARKRFHQLKEAAITMQSMWRGTMVRHELSRQWSAAQIIQMHYRNWLITKAIHEEYCRIRSNIILIQAAFRGWRSRCFVAKVRASICIQSHWRGYCKRISFMKTKQQLIVAQSCVRRWLIQRKLHQQTVAAIAIQSIYRRWLVQQSLQQQHLAATNIQTLFRCYSARRKYQKLYQSVTIIQQHYRAMRTMQAQRYEYLIVKGACITLQASVRGYLVRKRYLQEKVAVIRLQSFYKCYQQRRYYTQLRQSVITLQHQWQAICLGRIAYNKYQAIRQSTLTIQSYYRGWAARKYYAKALQSVLTIQSVYRRMVCQQSYLAKKSAAIVLQSYIRRWSARRSYIEKYQSIRILQASIRGWLQGQAVRRVCHFYTIKESCILIQSRIRGYLARKEIMKEKAAVQCIENGFITYLQRCQYLKTHRSIIIIQRWWLSIVKGRICRQSYQSLVKSSISIQSAWRMFIARRQYIQYRKAATIIQSHYRRFRQVKYYARMQKAATIIQQRYRAQAEMKKVSAAYTTLVQSSIILQSAWRGYVVRYNFFYLKKAAIVIQSYCRRYLCCKSYNKMKTAVLTIQQRYRAQTEMKREQKIYANARTSAIKLQAAFRGYQQRKLLANKQIAATKIQALWKMNVQRTTYQRQYHACTTLQTRFRATILGLRTRKYYLQLLHSTIFLQSIVRRWHCSTHYRRQRRAACVLQTHWRSYSAQKKYQIQRVAIVKIQQRWRATMIRNRLYRLFQQIKYSNIIIQKWVRRYLAIKQYNILKSAVKIQSIYRGYVCRRQYKTQRNAAIKLQSKMRMYKQRCHYVQQYKAICVIQKYTKAYLLGQQIRQYCNYSTLKESSIIIQTAFRRHAANKRFQELRSVTIKMQALIRGKIAKTRYDQVRMATINLQHRLRANWIAKEELWNYHFIRGAIITIQSTYRSYTIRSRYCQLKYSTIKMQARVRCWQERNRYIQLCNAAVAMQRRYRSKVIARELQQKYQQLRHNTILLQASCRGYLCRKNQAQRNIAAVTIQSCYRGYQVRRSQRLLLHTVTKLQAMYRGKMAQTYYKRLLQFSSIMQQRYRAKLAMKKAMKDYLDKRVAIVKLQSAIRGTLSRREVLRIRSAVKLQAYVRGMLQRQQYIKLRQSAVLIQSHMRGLIAYNKYQRQRNAIIDIQRWYRARRLANSTRYNYLYTLGAVITIQAVFRGSYMRKQLTKQHIAATQIQTMYRCYYQRNRYRCLRNSVILLQAYVRCQQQQERFQVMQRATCTIQNYYQAYKVGQRQREMYHQIRAMVIRLQSCWRGYITRKHLAYENAALILQKRYRANAIGQEIRKNYLQLRVAAIRIQAYYRGQQCRKWATKLAACRTILAYWRGYLIRKSIAKQNQAVKVIQVRWRLHHGYVQANRRVIKAATLIQATWRGYIVRLNQLKQNKALEDARQRIKQANEAVTEDKKLSNRTKSALRWLLKPNIYMSKLHEALRNLDNPTKFSQVCSENLANSDALEIIFKLIKSLNHSVPSYDLNTAALDVLINVASFPTCTHAVYETENSIATIIHVIHGYINKNNKITYKASHLLKILLQSGDTEKKVKTLAKDVTSSKKLIKIFEKLATTGNNKHIYSHHIDITRKNRKITSCKPTVTSCLQCIKELLKVQSTYYSKAIK